MVAITPENTRLRFLEMVEALRSTLVEASSAFAKVRFDDDDLARSYCKQSFEFISSSLSAFAGTQSALLREQKRFYSFDAVAGEFAIAGTWLQSLVATNRFLVWMLDLDSHPTALDSALLHFYVNQIDESLWERLEVCKRDFRPLNEMWNQARVLVSRHPEVMIPLRLQRDTGSDE